MANTNSSSGGISLFGALFLIFLTLKLIGVAPVAAWSWWWVTAPLWGGFAAVLGIFAIGAAVVGIASLASGKRQIRRLMAKSK